MKPRSAVFGLFAKYARFQGGSIRLQPLTELLSSLDIAPSTARVVMSRLRREGWFDTSKIGRETIYALNERSFAVLEDGWRRIFIREQRPWRGLWSMVIYSVPEKNRALREEIRKELAWQGFGPLAPSTWICPHDRLAQVRTSLSERPAIRAELLTASSGDLAIDRDMAARCWNLAEINQHYEELLAAHRSLLNSPLSDLTDVEAFVHLHRIMYEFRVMPFIDPDLPAELLPDDWRGVEAHRTFLELYEHLRGPAERHFHRVVGDVPYDDAQSLVVGPTDVADTTGAPPMS